jgi:1-acyl-sn-glycerol-3-phosphate acyltransferase
MIKFFNWFTKITAWLVQKICFRTKVYYENKDEQGRRIRGSAIIMSNHTSIYDYAVFLFIFYENATLSNGGSTV